MLGTDLANYGGTFAPFDYKIETTFSGVVLDEGDGPLFRKGIVWAIFQPQALTANNTDLQNNYQFAQINLNFPDYAYDIWHKRFVIMPTTSGTVRLMFKNYRGLVSRGIGTANNCCANIMVNVASNVRLQKLRLVLH
jgi:hypothetical protein